MKKSLLAAALLLAVCSLGFAQIAPSGTYLYAQKDGQDLFVDVYEPAEGSQSEGKPAIIFMFGGGFKTGSRADECYFPWYKMLCDRGFRVFSIDYRLGLKDVTKVGVSNASAIYDAIQIAVEDLYSATAFIVENAGSFGVDPSSIVISGSSAGAITALEAEWECANAAPRTSALPEGFRYAGVISFSGAVFSKEGKVTYDREPAPTMLLHGTADKIVNYKETSFFSMHFSGSSVLVKEFEKQDYNYRIYRFNGNGHEIASIDSMVASFDEQMNFISANVMKGEKRIVDALVSDPAVPVSATANDGVNSIYEE